VRRSLLTPSIDSGVCAVAADATSLLGILRGQRDRFHAQMLELEGEVGLRKREAEDCKAKLDRVLEDNVKLYEKIKYVVDRRARLPSRCRRAQLPRRRDCCSGELYVARSPCCRVVT
jgi:hypothetical protein